MMLFALILNIRWIIYFICAAGSSATEEQNHLSIFWVLTGVLNTWLIYSMASGLKLASFFKVTRKRIIRVAAIIFLTACLVPPWQLTEDINGSSGFHSQRPTGYSIIFSPPPRIDRPGCGVKIDFGRLFLEWMFIVGTSAVVFFSHKPTLVEKAAEKAKASLKATQDALDAAQKAEDASRGEHVEFEAEQVSKADFQRLLGEADGHKFSKPEMVDLESTLMSQARSVRKDIKGGMDPKDYAGTVRQIAKNLVQSGIRDRDELVNSVHAWLEKAGAKLTRNQTRDLISGYSTT